MTTEVQEILQVWRHGERLLEDLPRHHPDHAALRSMVDDLRRLYATVTAHDAALEASLRHSRAAIRDAMETLERVSATRLAAEGSLDMDPN